MKSMEEVIRKVKMKKEWKIAFFSAIIFGIIAHAYVIFNFFPNHDGLYNIYSTQNCTYLGRWLLQYACLASSYYTLPVVIGTLSILYIALTVVMIVELFDIKNKISIILISGIMMLFPTIASTFSYLFTMDGYMLALLLATGSVLVTYKYKKSGVLIGAILLCCSIGIYQAYLSFAIVLCMVKILLSFLQKQKDYKSILKDIILIVLGFIFYYISLKIAMRAQNMSLANYQGANNLMILDIKNMFIGIKEAYKYFFYFPIQYCICRNNVITIVANVIVCISIIIIFMKEYIKNKIYKDYKILICTILILLSMPIAFYIIKVISNDTYYHMLMLYTWCIPYIVLVILMEKINIKEIFRWIIAISLIYIIFNFYIMSNIAYSNMEQKFEKTYSLGLRIVDRIEQCDDYHIGMHVAIIGNPSIEYYPSTSATTDFNITGTEGDFIYFEEYHYESFFKNYFNFTIVGATDEEIENIKLTEEYQDMEQWPSKESVDVINDILVINFQ